LGKEKFEGVDIRVRVKGGGQISQVYGKKMFLCQLRGFSLTLRKLQSDFEYCEEIF
jgi:ribosomal protein S9